ncbi:SusC/RagA family TonB-linked outer membrane protein [Polaribacter reichenbachii]|uniref:SusC/RagA family TonB-linked outer membrane protein n=1 Tax=Polaribacter reichenbachii TaxID=996801 RepID=A0A1B8TRD0_9FLAO|nr:SusC/RagA family TonB-linked outer membrane protein [Polaribacter reichenbachii]APZ47769.1 SusC/RagA family TonB-linked outer membrane protein [Polaribacter reichenbachii]AUC18404.1 SusC/RagA family TonB-linked outer membrane protein [Polaribacter reichenbachii]OBY62246.1 SusC/RagA family TonB-linked outer membrane protein [Polaribacter reichenbachii]
MKKFKLLLIGILLTSSFTMFAQQTINGVVKEKATGEPLPGVSILVKGTTKGTQTDFDGNFSLDKVKTGDILVFNYLGFADLEVTIGTNFNIEVALTESSEQLDEIVVVGYGSIKKEDLTGTTDLLTSDDFNKGPIVSAQSLISGKVAGVNVIAGSGAPGDGQTINIRGTGSLSLTSQPLYVIDGIPLDNGGVGGSRNPLNFINPNDIETFVVLKDASSTAIYGSRAANGVILITTKKGKDRDFKFNISSQTTVYTLRDKVDVLSADQFSTLINDIGTPNQIALLGNANTDWQEEIYTTAIGQDHNFSALGNLYGVPMRASLGYSEHEGILKGDNLARTTASINLSPSFLDDHLKVDLNAKGMYTENTFANRGAIGGSISFDPTQAIFDPNSQYGGYFAWLDAGTGNQNNLAPTNPIALLDLIDDTAEIRRLVANAKIDYKIHGLEDLTATINLGFDTSNSHGRTITSELIPTSDATFNGSLTSFVQKSDNKVFDAYLTYTKTFNEAHNLTVVGGHAYQSFEYDNYSFDSEAQEDGNTFEFVDKSKNVLLSYFGRANYDYKGKYYLTATLRADASSKLNPDDRWGIFPSFAAAWSIHKEAFMEDSFFNELKLRVGYGEIGNINGLGDYQFLTRYNGSTDTANYQFGSAFYQTFRPEPINKDLRWEVGKTFNLGMDFAFLDRRISGSVNAYIKQTNDLIASSIVDPFTNFGNRINANIGNMENRGLEFNINATPIRTDNFEWSVNYNISLNDNEITQLSVDQPQGGISTGVGNNVQVHREGETANSFYVFQQVYGADGKPLEGVFVDRNNDNTINDDDKYINEDPFADVLMGFNTNINYKNWDFSIQTRASFGNYMYNDVAANRGVQINATNNNILSNLHSDYYNSGFTVISDKTALSDHFVQDASFFKIDNISLGYTLDKIKNTTFRFYGSLQNVLIVTDYDGLDPEINLGIDNNFYPRPRSFVLGANINF